MHVTSNTIMLHTPHVKSKNLYLPSCPPPPQVHRSKISYVRPIEKNGNNDFDQVPVRMFPALPFQCGSKSKSNELPRTRRVNSTRDMVLKPCLIHGDTSFAQISPPSLSPPPVREREDCIEDEAMKEVSIGKVSNESGLHSNLLGFVQNSLSSTSKYA